MQQSRLWEEAIETESLEDRQGGGAAWRSKVDGVRGYDTGHDRELGMRERLQTDREVKHITVVLFTFESTLSKEKCALFNAYISSPFGGNHLPAFTASISSFAYCKMRTAVPTSIPSHS
jgi:hypothetical protein